METNFASPQRQSKIGIIIMFFDTVQQYARALWPVLAIWIFKFNELSILWLVLGTALIILIIAIVAYLKYVNFTFFLDNENQEFIVTEGVFNKTKTTIQLDKIQQVNIKQSLLQRIIGVHALDVDTAGSNDKEISVRAISHQLALELKFRLLENETRKQKTHGSNEQANPANAISSHAETFIQISFLSLLKVGITSNYLRSIGLLLAFFATIYDNLMRLPENEVIDDDQITGFVTQNLVMSSVAILIALLFAGILILNVLRIIIKYFNFKIARQSGSLLLSFGLLNLKSTIIKPEKVQIVSVSRNYFQKKLNILELKIKQASSGEKEERKQAVDIPGCNAAECDAILKLLYKAIPEKGVMLKPNFRKLGFAIFLAIILPLCALYCFAVNAAPDFFRFSYLVPIYVIFTGTVLYFSFKNNRLFINDRFIIKQSGAWDIENRIIEPHRIQAITTSQLFWHKGINIGSLTLHTAGGNVAFELGNFSTIKQYVNLWLYELETSDSNWM